MARALSHPELSTKASGTYHLSMAGETTWHGFAKEILVLKKIDISLVPIPSREYKTAAPRPGNSLLDCSKLVRAFGIELPDWREGLREVSSRIGAV